MAQTDKDVIIRALFAAYMSRAWRVARFPHPAWWQ
jgi:hypothetical protein